VYIKKEKGYWHLTKKKDLSQVTGINAVLKSVNDKKQKKESGDVPAKKKDVPLDIKAGAKLNKQSSSKPAISSDQDTIAKSNSQTINKSTIKPMFSSILGGIDLKKHVNSALYVGGKYLATFHLLLFVFLVIGVINWTRIKKVRYFGFYIASVIVFYLLVLYRLNLAFPPALQYPSRRHLIPLVIPAIFCVGIGVHVTGSWIHEKLQFGKLKSGLRGRLRNVWMVQLLILMIIVSVLLPKTLKPQRSDKLGIKEVGQWIRENSNKPSPAILSISARNAYYARGTHVQVDSINNALSNARAKKVDYILITHREYRVIEKELLQSVKDKKIALAHKFPEGNSLNKRSILLYKVLH